MEDHADLLRRAATKARETAQDATPGPWTPERKSVLDSDDVEFVEATRRDARHIALWHPGVALAVAEWLEDAARDLPVLRAVLTGPDWERPEYGGEDPDEVIDRRFRHLLTVARALLNEPKEV